MIEVLILKKYFEFQLIDYGFVKTMVFTQLKQTIYTIRFFRYVTPLCGTVQYCCVLR